jgi:mRNA-degrading endonuclease RelE of RelBE toxin-antitoxin system
MRFIETLIFTREVRGLLPDDDYRALQAALMLRPEQGALIQGAGGLRKIRWGGSGRGKRGGLRVIYFWDDDQEAFYMLLAYGKSDQEDLTPSQLRVLSRLVREEFQ